MSRDAAIYLSPHLDDAVCACGGAIARRVKRGQRVVVATVFTADPPGADELTGHLDGAWGVRVDAAMRVRRREDLAAVRRLGAEPLWLGHLGALARRPAVYLDQARLYGEPVGEESLVAELAELFGELAATWRAVEMVAPLGIDRHVDHQVVHAAARSLEPAHSIAYFEDVPGEAAPDEQLRRRLEALGGAGRFVPEVVDVGAEVEVKLAAIGLYHGQLDVAPLDGRELLADGARSERVWRRAGPPRQEPQSRLDAPAT